MSMEFGSDAPLVLEPHINNARFLIMGEPVSQVIAAWVFLDGWPLMNHPEFPRSSTVQESSTI
jgi:hypothetical protein